MAHSVRLRSQWDIMLLMGCLFVPVKMLVQNDADGQFHPRHPDCGGSIACGDSHAQAQVSHDKAHQHLVHNAHFHRNARSMFGHFGVGGGGLADDLFGHGSRGRNSLDRAANSHSTLPARTNAELASQHDAFAAERIKAHDVILSEDLVNEYIEKDQQQSAVRAQSLNLPQVSYPWTGHGHHKSRRLHILLVSMGSGAGDIQPLAVIGKRLMQEGHSVRFGAHKKHQKIIEDSGVRYVSFDGFSPDEILSDAPDGTILKPLQQVDEKFINYIKFRFNGESSTKITNIFRNWHQHA
jgi:hypothetical protein